MSIRIEPLTPDRWPDLEALFGPSGAYSGCWCMFLRKPSSQFDADCRNGGAANRADFRAAVEAGPVPGLLAFRDGDCVGWVAVAAREAYSRVLRSPIHKPIDDAGPVYSISCFFVAPSARGSGVADALLEAAVEFARSSGAAFVEAYPNDQGGDRRPAADVWRGTLTQFERAGFRVVARRKPARPIVRREV